MPDKADLTARDLYLSIMEEVKIRAFSLNAATNIPNGIPPPLICEYCFLQLRMLCELIALGCLVAHGDIATTKAFQTAYKADDILKKLEHLHPDFYPVPVTPILQSGEVHLENSTADFLSKSDLITLYGKRGDILHRGNLRRLISGKNTRQVNYQDIHMWGQKILNLLSSHRIIRANGNFVLIAVLEAQDRGGNVVVALAER
jgi:hypothetical protein